MRVTRNRAIGASEEEPPGRRMRVTNESEGAQSGAGSSDDVRIDELVESDMCEPECQVIAQAIRMMEKHYGDISGEWLGPDLVQKSCADGMLRFREMLVYGHMLREEAQSDPEGKIIGVRWVKVNEDTVLQSKVRRRLVAQEFATY